MTDLWLILEVTLKLAVIFSPVIVIMAVYVYLHRERD